MEGSVAERSDRARWVVVGAVVLGFVLRVAWAWWATRQPQGSNDPVTYALLADSIAHGHGYSTPLGAPTAYFPPGYPVALGALFWIANHVGLDQHLPGVASGFNVVLGTATIGLLALVARRLFGWRTAAVVAVVLAVFPTLIGYSSLMLSETLFVFLVAVALLLALWHPLTAVHSGLVRLGLASFVLGLALLVRPVGALLVVALLVGIVLAGGGARRVLLRAGVVVVVVAAVLVPWAVRNSVSVGAGLTLSTNTGDNLCIGNNPDATGTFAISPYCFDDLPDQDPPGKEAEVARANATQSRAVEWIKANPLAQPRLLLLRTAATFQHGHEFRWASQSYGADLWLDDAAILWIDWFGDVGWFAVLALGLCGLPILWWRPDPRRIVILLSFVGLTLATWPFFGNPRFGVPAVALLAIPAGAVLAGLPDVWRRYRAVGPEPIDDSDDRDDRDGRVDDRDEPTVADDGTPDGRTAAAPA